MRNPNSKVSNIRLLGLRQTALTIALIGAVMGCGDDSVSAPPVATSLEVASTKVAIEVGESLTIATVARDARDSLVNNLSVIWSSTPSGVASVSNGVVTGVAPGTAYVQATVQSASASIAIDVVPAAVASISLSAPSVTLAPDASVAIAAVVRDARQAPLSGRIVTWSSSDTRRMQVNAAGVATAVSPGTAYVVARSESARDSLLLTVSGASAMVLVLTPDDIEVSVGRKRTLSARLRNVSGALTIPNAVSWASDNAQIVSVNNGVVTGVAPGTTVIRAQSGSMIATASVSVSTGGVVFAVGNYTTDQNVIRADSINVSGTLVAAGPLTLVSSGDIVISGAVIAPCQSLKLIAGGRILVTHADQTYQHRVDNSCEEFDPPDPAPGIHIEGAGGYQIVWTIVRSSGAIHITNDAGLVDANFIGAPIARENEHCSMAYAIIDHRVKTSVPSTSGATGRDGANIYVSCRGSFRTSSTNINSGGGSNGGSSTNAGLAIAGDGGRSGRTQFRVTGDVIIDVRRLYFRINSSGSGGDATATAFATDGAHAMAVGGRGGDMGGPGQPPIEFRVSGDVIQNFPTTSNAIEMGLFTSGRGGNAVATGAIGRDATALLPAGAGGSASAISGRSGNVFPSLISVGGSTPEGTIWMLGQSAGVAGSATGAGGHGGHGSAEYPHGAPGGSVLAEGGDGGDSGVNSARGTPASGGAGGTATFQGGIGGNGFDRCSPVGVGGRGGAGGTLTGSDGRGGTGQIANALDGGTAIASAANGGAGGRGATPGVGGRAGTDATQTRGPRTLAPPSLVDGATGGACTSPP